LCWKRGVLLVKLWWIATCTAGEGCVFIGDL
jgi:hypothetical protein